MVKPGRLTVAAQAPLVFLPTCINWKKCCLCQSENNNLRCPAKNPIVTLRNSGYISLASNLEKLKTYPSYTFPSRLKVDLLDEGDGILTTSINREAKWHKACANRYLTPKFESLIESLLPSSSHVAELSDPEPNNAPAYATRSAMPMIDLKQDLCLICGEPGSWKNPLRLCVTDGVDDNIKECANVLKNFKITGIVMGGDLSAKEGKYHPKCLARMYNMRRRIQCTTNEESMVMCEGIAFANLVLYIQAKIESSTSYVFKMVTLKREYINRLAQLLGKDISEVTHVHTTRMRHKILAHFPDLKQQKAGREYVLMHESANILYNLAREDQDEDALAFQRFAKNLRKEMSGASSSFTGDFNKGCEENSIPPALLATINMIMYGSTVRQECRATRPALSVCQLIMLNRQQSMPKGGVVRHKKQHEPPLPLYMALSTYGRTRSQKVINEMHNLGISVSYNRVMEVTSQLCYMVVQRADEEKVLCPSNLKSGIFTMSALDNIDHNPYSTTSEGSFHGTGISIFQLPMKGNKGTDRAFATSFQDVAKKGQRSVPILPESYALVPEYTLKIKKPDPYQATSIHIGDKMQPSGLFIDEWHKENSWLNHVHELISQSGEGVLNASWGAFHAGRKSDTHQGIPAIHALLPLFHEKSESVSMIRHGMNIVSRITNYLNKGQIPVMCADQPLFTLAKLIQWNWPSLYAEDKFVMLLGPFHIEKSFLRVLGQFLEDSGWTSIMCNAGITTTGSAEAYLKVTHVTKARAMHQVTAAVLHSLLLEAFQNNNNDELSLEDWISNSSKSSPTFKYWATVLNLQILLLSFVRAVRQGDYNVFKESLRRMLPW